MIDSMLADFKKGKIDANKLKEAIASWSAEDIGFARLDHHRAIRKGSPETIFCQGKTPAQVKKIIKTMMKSEKRVIATRATPELYSKIKIKGLRYNKEARIMHWSKEKVNLSGEVAVITAGTADIPVAEEAAVTCELLGSKVTRFYDVGVAGIHRLLMQTEKIRKANVVIVVAGMEGALPSVVAGIVGVPVIGVPTSVGYGTNLSGFAPLLTMLNSCAPGLSVVNIDNGFGAGYLANMVNKGK